MKTALQQYDELKPQVGESVEVFIMPLIGGVRRTPATIVELLPETAEVRVRFSDTHGTMTVGPTQVTRPRESVAQYRARVES